LADAARREAGVRACALARARREGRVQALFEAQVAAVASGGPAGDGALAAVASPPGDGGEGQAAGKRALGVDGKEAEKMAKREGAAAGDLMELDVKGKSLKRPLLGGFGKRFG